MKIVGLENETLDWTVELIVLPRAQVPSVNTAVAFLPPRALHNDLQPIPCFELRDLLQTLSILVHLLDFTLPEREFASAAATTSIPGVSSLEWMFHVVLKISVLLNHLSSAIPHRLDEKIAFFMNFIGFFHRLSVSVRYSSLDSATTHQIVSNVSNSFVATLQDSLVGHSQELQILICRSLHELSEFSETSSVISAALYDHIVPFLQIFLKSGQQITIYSADLQVIKPLSPEICHI